MKAVHLLAVPVLVCLSLLGLGGAPGCASGPAPHPPELPADAESPPRPLAAAQLPADGVEPLRYHLELSIDPRQETFAGRGTIEIRVLRRTRRFFLHAAEMKSLSLQVEQGGRAQPATVGRVSREVAAADPGRIAVELSQPLEPGTARLHAVWQAPFDAHLSGLYRASEAGRWYAYTQFEVADARKAFPCFDEPRFKTPFEIALTVPATMDAASNAPVASVESQEGGFKTVHFEPTAKLPTYLVAFYVGDGDVVEGPKAPVPVHGFAAKGKGPLLEEALTMHAELIAELERYFDLPFPFPKLDAVAVLEFAAGAMENAGLITYREELLLIDPKHTSEKRRRQVAAVIAHELAHQYFGDLVTLAWWDDLWLNESFATWMEYELFRLWHPEWHPEIQRVEDRAYAMRADALPTARPIRRPAQTLGEIEQNFDGIVYSKGAAVLHMLSRWIGPERFQAGLRRYMRAHAYGSATAEDLFAALGEASGEAVRQVARPFIETPGVPEVEAKLICGEGPPRLRLKRRRYRPLGLDAPERDAAAPWWIPVCWAAPSGEGVARGCVLLDRDTKEVELEGVAGCPAWVHPNASESGYYYWALPGPALAALAEGVRDPASRAGLVQQAEAALDSGRLLPGAYLDFLGALASSEDPRDVGRAVDAVGRMVRIWPQLKHDRRFQRWVRDHFESRGRDLGLDPKPDEPEEVRELRPRLMVLLARVGRAPWALEGIAARARRWLEDPESLAPEVLPAYLSTAAAEGRIAFETLRKALEGRLTPPVRVAVLGALGALPEGGGMDEALALLLGDAIRKQDLFYVLGPMMGDVERLPHFFGWLKGSWRALVAKMPGFGGRAEVRLPALIGSFCDEAGRDEARAFFDTIAIEGSERAYAEGLARAGHCIAVRRHGDADLARWLSRIEAAK